ncbi:MAG: AAA family ATPase [bacterium]|nr:AAA family ATPase [bacterium]
MKTTIISIVNQKGGVGKTTTAVNLSSYLADLGHKVLLLDFDPQANATSGIGINKHDVKHTVYDALMDATLLGDCIYPTAFDGLHILPASPDLAGAEIELSGVENREYYLRNILAEVSHFYNYVIIDCAPSLGLLTINALAASHKALIPVQCEYYALEGIAHLINTLDLVKQGINPELTIAGIVLTMFDSRTSLNKMVVNNAKVFFKELVFDTVIPRNVRLAEAPSHGLPISLYNPLSRGSKSYFNLAKEFVIRVQ